MANTPGTKIANDQIFQLLYENHDFFLAPSKEPMKKHKKKHYEPSPKCTKLTYVYNIDEKKQNRNKNKIESLINEYLDYVPKKNKKKLRTPWDVAPKANAMPAQGDQKLLHQRNNNEVSIDPMKSEKLIKLREASSDCKLNLPQETHKSLVMTSLKHEVNKQCITFKAFEPMQPANIINNICLTTGRNKTGIFGELLGSKKFQPEERNVSENIEELAAENVKWVQQEQKQKPPQPSGKKSSKRIAEDCIQKLFFSDTEDKKPRSEEKKVRLADKKQKLDDDKFYKLIEKNYSNKSQAYLFQLLGLKDHDTIVNNAFKERTGTTDFDNTPIIKIDPNDKKKNEVSAEKNDKVKEPQANEKLNEKLTPRSLKTKNRPCKTSTPKQPDKSVDKNIEKYISIVELYNERSEDNIIVNNNTCFSKTDDITENIYNLCNKYMFENDDGFANTGCGEEFEDFLISQAKIIQNFWRRNRQALIFKELKTKLANYRKQDPIKVLRPISTIQAKLFDRRNDKLEIKFDGTTFPPMIVYKVITKKCIVNVEAKSLAKSSSFENLKYQKNKPIWNILYVYKPLKQIVNYSKPCKRKIINPSRRKHNYITWIADMYL